MSKKSLFALALSLLFVGQLLAQSVAVDSEEPSICLNNCIEQGQWQWGIAMGYGGVTNPIAGDKDLQLPLLPRFAYYSDNFFIENFTMGYSFVQGEGLNIELLGSFNQDFLHFETASKLQKAFAWIRTNRGQDVLIPVGEYNLKDRNMTYLLGPSVRYLSENWSAALSYQWDAFNVNGGKEATFELGQNFSQNNWSFSHHIGATYKSRTLVDYYYGLSREEAPALIAVYHPKKSAVNTFYKFNTSYPVSERWTFLLSLKAEKLDEPIFKSNIVQEDHVTSFFIGMGYDFQ